MSKKKSGWEIPLITIEEVIETIAEGGYDQSDDVLFFASALTGMSVDAICSELA